MEAEAERVCPSQGMEFGTEGCLPPKSKSLLPLLSNNEDEYSALHHKHVGDIVACHYDHSVQE